MTELRDNIGALFDSIAGVLIYISLAFWIDLNGFAKYAMYIALAGMLLILFKNKILKGTSLPTSISEPSMITVAYILVFIGLYPYLDKYTPIYWLPYLVIGIILLNRHKQIAKAIIR